MDTRLSTKEHTFAIISSAHGHQHNCRRQAQTTELFLYYLVNIYQYWFAWVLIRISFHFWSKINKRVCNDVISCP